MFIATLIAAQALSQGDDVDDARDRLAAAGCAPGDWRWIEEGEACDLPFAPRPGCGARGAVEGAFPGADVVVQPRGDPRARSCSSPTWIRR